MTALEETIAVVMSGAAASAAVDADIERQVYDAIELDPDTQLAVGRRAHPDIRRAVVVEELERMDEFQAGAIRALAAETAAGRVNRAVREELAAAFDEDRPAVLDAETLAVRAFGGRS